MGNILRTRQILWNAATTGATGKSGVANLNGFKYATVFIKVNGATTVTFEVSPGVVAASNPELTNRAGRNEVAGLVDADFYAFYEDDMSAQVSVTFAGAGSAAFDLSPVAYPFFRLVSSNSVTATAVVTGIQ